MISRQLAGREVMRMAGLEFFAALSEASVDELVRAVRSAPDEIIAVAVVNEWLQTSPKRPTPADIYRGIERHANARQIAGKPEFLETGISFERWVALGFTPDWDIFLDWVCSDELELPAMRQEASNHQRAQVQS